jgi:hypothetical protein
MKTTGLSSGLVFRQPNVKPVRRSTVSIKYGYLPDVETHNSPADEGQSVRAQRLARPIAELTTVLFRETNPVPLKQALALLGAEDAGIGEVIEGIGQ